MNEDQHLAQARRRVKEKKKFYTHLTTYLAMGGFFFTLNVLTSPGNWWFYWPMLGWGIGVAIQYFKVFGIPGSGLGSPEWEERELEKEMKRLNPDREKAGLDLDSHLELRELDANPQKEASYRKDDLV